MHSHKKHKQHKPLHHQTIQTPFVTSVPPVANFMHSHKKHKQHKPLHHQTIQTPFVTSVPPVANFMHSHKKHKQHKPLHHQTIQTPFVFSAPTLDEALFPGGTLKGFGPYPDAWQGLHPFRMAEYFCGKVQVKQKRAQDHTSHLCRLTCSPAKTQCAPQPGRALLQPATPLEPWRLAMPR